jgi:tRNA threonylcarbamoyl adenosine modification protein YeaZ
MKKLALEFSAKERSVAVAEHQPDGGLRMLGSVRESSREVTGMAMVERAMREAGVDPGEITEIVVGLGPGSYTGIRSAIALAQGWQLGREVPVRGVGSVECLAGQAQEGGLRGEYTFIVDAQRGEVYRQRFVLTGEGVERLDELRIVPRGEVSELESVIGPEANQFAAKGIEMAPSAEYLVKVRAEGKGMTAEELEPIYLRETAFVKAPKARLIE